MSQNKESDVNIVNYKEFNFDNLVFSRQEKSKQEVLFLAQNIMVKIYLYKHLD